MSLEIITPTPTVLEVISPTPTVLELTSPGPQGIQGPSGVDFTQTFETVANNHRGFDVISTTFVDGVSLTKVFDSDNGTTITSTLLFGLDGNPTTKTLTGTGLPPGIDTVCTYDFTDRTIPLKTYSS